MPSNSKSIFTPAAANIQRKHVAQLEAIFQGISPSTVLAIAGPSLGRSHGLSGNNDIDMLEAPGDWLEDLLTDMSEQADLFADPITFRPAVIEIDPYGVHFVDALFGAQIRFHGDQCWSSELPYDLENLKIPNLDQSLVFQSTLHLCEMAVEAVRSRAGAGSIYVTAPVLACAINIGINLFGERLLEALHTRPEAAQSALAKIHHTILEATQRVYAVLPSSIRRNSVAGNRLALEHMGQFDGCATQLISRRDYARFFAGLDSELIRQSPQGALIHLCGAHTQHIPVLASLSGLRAVQLNDRAMDDLETYYHLLPGNIVFYLSPSETVGIEKIMEITGGRRVVLQASITQQIAVGRLD